MSNSGNELSDPTDHDVERETEAVETDLGSAVVRTVATVKNPTTDKYQDLRNLSEDGYCRRFLALLAHVNNVGTVNVDTAPILTFDKGRWDLEEKSGHYVLVKKEAESDFGEMVLNE